MAPAGENLSKRLCCTALCVLRWSGHRHSGQGTPVQLDLFYHPDRAAERPSTVGVRDLSELDALLQPRLDDIPGVSVPTVLRPDDPVGFGSTLTRTIAAWLQGDLLSRLEANSLAGT